MRETVTVPDRTRLRLVVAVALLVAATALLLLTSTPTSSPASTWATWAWQLRYRVASLDDTPALSALHLDAEGRPREQCVACHGDKTSSELLVHRIHLGSELLRGLACAECHPSVRIGPRETVTGARWVDVGFCKECHSEFPGGLPDSRMHAEDIDADCTGCHTGDRAMRHAKPYLSQIIDPSECRGCHGGRALPWNPRHERADWLRVHGADALEVGTDTCFACHDFGLKFCAECHAVKPASHLPENRWLATHPDAARADTRVCYTCHSTDHCKECHIDHEAGWMETHPTFVHENGSASCTECHSLSGCSFCHSETPAEGAEPAASPGSADSR